MARRHLRRRLPAKATHGRTLDRLARGQRRVRYRGVERYQLGLTIRVAAINLRRLVNLGLTRAPTAWNLAECGPGH